MRHFFTILLLLQAFGFAGTLFAAPSPEEVFRNPPASARVGVWWHWMGSQVTREGILADLDWFKQMGIGYATIFGVADSTSPWAREIGNPPAGKLIAFSPAWWRLVRFACEEGLKRGIDIGLHNCPGYTSTGGTWIPPRLAMRELVFNVTNVEEQISLVPNARFPVWDEKKARYGRPDCPARRTDIQEIAVVKGIRVAHIPMGAYIQPAQAEVRGLECDKMNPEAVAFHLDHVVGEIVRYFGPRPAEHGLRHILLDSYEAGQPTWTPKMREEFQKRRGYDPLPYLPVLGGFDVCTPEEAEKFKKDYKRTIADLYRDVLFKMMHERIAALGIDFSCEPYWGPFNPRECAAFVDRLMTEFWSTDMRPHVSIEWNDWMGWYNWKGPNGRRHNVIEAEAFTGQPEVSMWTETPWFLKRAGDFQYTLGVNRFMLHACPLQPWGADVRPGVTMGCWGTHFGRTQTWARDGKAWFDYLNRSQALLQWGELSRKRLKTTLRQFAREADGCEIYYLANATNRHAVCRFDGPHDEWFDPVFGTITRPPRALAPYGAGFLVRRGRDTSGLPPYPHGGAHPLAVVKGPWRVSFDSAWGGPAAEQEWTNLIDWTKSADPGVRYYSGTATYHATFDFSGDSAAARVLNLGNCNGQLARVRLNGRDLGVVWCAPWEAVLPAGLLRTKGNRLEIDFTNVWANRLIGDECEPPDFEGVPGARIGKMLFRYPDWFSKGLAARPSKGRRTFSTWNYFVKPGAKLAPSGLLGPVVIR